VWHEVCELLKNPRRLEQEYQDRRTKGASLEDVETLKAQGGKLRHAMERLIDSFTEGLIDKNQFKSRMEWTKRRIADLDSRINAGAGDMDSLENLRSATKRLRDLAAAVGPDLASEDWHRRREIIRTLVQRIDIEMEIIKIVFRLTQSPFGSRSDSIVITIPRK
jgi:site-specific DNA recombinase